MEFVLKTNNGLLGLVFCYLREKLTMSKNYVTLSSEGPSQCFMLSTALHCSIVFMPTINLSNYQ